MVSHLLSLFWIKPLQILETESQNHLGWKITLRSSAPNFNLALPSSPLNHLVSIHPSVYTGFSQLLQDMDFRERKIKWFKHIFLLSASKAEIVSLFKIRLQLNI